MPTHTVPLPQEAHAGNAVLLTYSKRGVFPPLSLQGPFFEVLRLISGVSVPQESLFWSSPGEMIYGELLPMATVQDRAKSSKHLTQSSAFYSQFTVPGAAPQLSVLFITSEDGNDMRMVSLALVISTSIFFLRKNCVYNLKSQIPSMKAYLQPTWWALEEKVLVHSSLYEQLLVSLYERMGLLTHAFRYSLDEPLKNAVSDVVLLGMGSQMLKLFFQEGHAVITNNSPK